MRCYFLKDQRIEAVAILKTAPDAELIREATTLFEEVSARYESFEVWDINRFVYRGPPKAGGA
jgi:hypothetical protein